MSIKEHIENATTPEELEAILNELEGLTNLGNNTLRAKVVNSDLRKMRLDDDDLNMSLMLRSDGAHVRAIEAFLFLRQMVNNHLGKEKGHELGVFNGAVKVEWNEKLMWLVYHSDVMWPAVRVRVYTTNDDGSVDMQSFRLASSLIEHSKKFL